MFFKLVLIVFSYVLTLNASESFDTLLNNYKVESDLSKVTKRDTSGFLDIYTREDLERMQVHNLRDVLNTIPGLYLIEGKNGLTLTTTPSVSKMPITYSRLYINDHDVTSSSFGSGFLIWGEMPTEYIDHIEIYRATSSMEFSNENAGLVIRLYTKSAQRDSGLKLRAIANQRGGYDTNFYAADILENGFSYFIYANKDNLKNPKYKHRYNGDVYNIYKNKEGHNFYGEFDYKRYKVEFGSYSTKADSFLGIGIHTTPNGGDLDAMHHYIHASYTSRENLKLVFSYDKLHYTRTYVDPNGIRIANAPMINNYALEFNDDIVSAVVEKKINTQKNKILIGAFYKYKNFEGTGNYSDTNQSYTHVNNSSNALNLYSLYMEDTYAFSNDTHFVMSAKSDVFRYNKDVKSQNEYLLKVGFVKKVGVITGKLFYQHSYIPLAFYQIYNPENIPYRANPDLETMKMDILTWGIGYDEGKDSLEFEGVYTKTPKNIVYNPSTTNGWETVDKSSWKALVQLSYTHHFDINNKVSLYLDAGRNSSYTNTSPAYNAIVRFFNKYKKLDFYNDLNYKSGYELYGMSQVASLDFTSAIKYHYSKDFSLGLRGENILNQGYKQIYRGLDYAIPVTPQLFWLNLEYTF